MGNLPCCYPSTTDSVFLAPLNSAFERGQLEPWRYINAFIIIIIIIIHLLLSPVTSATTFTNITLFSSLHTPIPLYHPFVHFLWYASHCRCLFRYFVLILVNFAIAHIHLNILISTTFNFFSSALFTAHYWYYSCLLPIDPQVDSCAHIGFCMLLVYLIFANAFK